MTKEQERLINKSREEGRPVMSLTMQKICTPGSPENIAIKKVMFEAYSNGENLTSEEIIKRVGEELKR